MRKSTWLLSLVILTGNAAGAATIQELERIIAIQQAQLKEMKSLLDEQRPKGEVTAFLSATCPKGWVPADGRNGNPDLRGLFLRGANNFGTDAGTRTGMWANPENVAIGSGQDQATAKNGLFTQSSSVTGKVNGDWSGSVSGRGGRDAVRSLPWPEQWHTDGYLPGSYVSKVPAGFGLRQIVGFYPDGQPSWSGSVSGKLTDAGRDVTATAAAQALQGDNETRPKNVSVLYCIRP